MHNEVILIGHLGADPDVRYTQQNTCVATLSLATNETYTDANGERREETEWHRCTLWGRLGEVAQQYCHKGQKIFVRGKLKTRKWTDKEGVVRYSTEVKVDTIKLLDRRSDDAAAPDGGAEATPAGADDGDELPF